jgi:tripartite-type tricarboxylate transporter receptor subunit TctC
MKIRRRNHLAWLAALGLASLIGIPAMQAQAQSKPTQIVVPYAPGGSTDLLGRILAENLAAPMGTSFIVENKPGAGTAIGATFVARAPADGKTLLMATSTTLGINPWLYKKLSYNPQKDFAPVAEVAEVPLVVVVNPVVKANSLAELVALAKKSKPGELNYASAGNGSPHHLVAEMFKSAVDIDLTHVPYKGSSPALTDVVAGHIPVMFSDLAPALPFIQSGRLRALAVTSGKRVGPLPDIPTVAESHVTGTKDFEGVAWQAVVAPAGTPQAVIDKLSAEIVKIMARPDIKGKLEKDGLVVRTRTAAQLGDYMAAELPRWGKVVKESGATLD